MLGRLRLIGITLLLALPVQAQNISVWLSTPDKSSEFAQQPQALQFGAGDVQLPSIEIDAKKKDQSVEGFGFALTGGSAQLLMKMDAGKRAALLQDLFGEEGSGIGVSYLRVSIGSSDLNDHVFTYDDMPAGQTDPQLQHFDLGEDKDDVIPVLHEILKIAPKLKILASPWSAPSWMKTNENPKGGSLKPEDYDVYARYLVKYLQAMKAAGIHIDTITMQNEPLNPKNTPSMVVTAEEEDKFIAQSFGRLLKKSGVGTKIVLYDHNCDHPEYATTILADPQASKYVVGSGFHLYGGQINAMSTVHEAYPKKDLYFTEQMVVDRRNDTALRVASPESRIVIGATRNWSRNVLLWNLAADPNFNPHTSNGGCGVCEGAITLDGDTVTRNLGYYTVAHVSKFVRPGSVRVESSDTLPNVAFRTPSGKMVLIVANTATEEKKFDIRVGTKAALAQLPAGAVATYVW